jgi:hypothetical protein
MVEVWKGMGEDGWMRDREVVGTECPTDGKTRTLDVGEAREKRRRM